MLTRNQKYTLSLAKQVLKEKGYTYRQAAPVLGVHFTHLAKVLTGVRISASLLRRISELPPRVTTEEAPSAPLGEVPGQPAPLA